MMAGERSGMISTYTHEEGMLLRQGGGAVVLVRAVETSILCL